MAELVKRVYSLEVQGYDQMKQQLETLTQKYILLDEAKRRAINSRDTANSAGDAAEVAKLNQQIAALTQSQQRLQTQLNATRREAEALAAAMANVSNQSAAAPVPSAAPNPAAPPTVEINQYVRSLAEVSELQVRNTLQLSANRQAQAALTKEIANSGSATDEQIKLLTTLRQEQVRLQESAKQYVVTERNLTNELLSQSGSVTQLSSQLNVLRQTYDRLSQTERDSDIGKAQLLNIQQLDTALKTLDAQQGRFQRNVGDYKQQYNGLNLAVQQILRETPSVAVSLNTFFLAISNNLPQLFDELTKTSAKAKEFAEELGKSNAAQVAAKGISDAAASAADNAGQSLSAQLGTVVESITASKEQAAALREQILATVSSGTATAEQAEITAVNTEQQLLNAGATVEDAAAIRGLIVSQGAATAASRQATVALEAQTIATAEVAAVSARSPSVFKQLLGSLFSFNTALTLGVLALTLFGGKIVDFISGLFKADDALDVTAQNLKNLTQLFKDAGDAAAKEQTSLDALYKSATNLNIPNEQRLKYVQQLKKEFPEYFGQLSNEAILNGQAEVSYRKLSEAILDSAKARAAQAQIEKLSAREIEIALDQATKTQAQRDAAANTRNRLGTATGARLPTVDELANFRPSNQQQAAVDENLIANQRLVNAEKNAAKENEIELGQIKRQKDFLLQYVGGEQSLADAQLDSNKKTEKEQKSHADKLTVADQNAFKEFDRIRALRLAQREAEILQIRQANQSTFGVEQRYLQDIEAINAGNIASKRGYLAAKGKLNREEALTDAELNLERIKNATSTQDAIVALRKQEADRLKEIVHSQANDSQNNAQGRLNTVQNNPDSTQVQRLQAQQNYLSELQVIEIEHFDELRAIEAQFSQDNTKEEQKRADTLLNIQKEQGKTSYDLEKARLDEQFELIKDKGVREITEVQRQNYLKTLSILGDDSTTSSQKAIALAKLEREQRLSLNQAELDDLYRQQTRKGIALKEFDKLEADIIAKKLEREKLAADKEKTYFDKVSDTLKGYKKNLTDFFKGNQASQEEVGNAIQAGVDIVKDTINQAYQAYFERQRQKIEDERDVAKERLGIEENQALFTAQSEAEKDSIRKQFAAKQKDIDKKASEERKSLALKQATIDFGLAVIKTLAAYPFPFSLIPVAALGLAYAVQRSNIASQKFAKGGYTGIGKERDETGHRVAGVVHQNEWVAPEWMNYHPRYSRVIAGLEGVRRRGFADGGFTSDIPSAGLRAPVNAAAFISPVNGGAGSELAEYAAYTERVVTAINDRIDRIQVVNDPRQTVSVANRYETANKIGVV